MSYQKIMEREYFLNLNKEIYRLTLLFPKKESLRYKMRELANDILADLIKHSFFQPIENKPLLQEINCLSELEILDCFFEIVKDQNWVKKEEIITLQRAYADLKERLKKIKFENNLLEPGKQNEVLPFFNEKPMEVLLTKEREAFFDNNKKELNERQEKILEFLKENSKTQVWQIKKIMPQVTKRTLRRDFEFLVKRGLIERIGERNNTFYQLKKEESDKIINL